MAVQIKMYWIAWTMKERMTIGLLKPGLKSNSEITD